MEYIKVIWKHEPNEYPVAMYSELSQDRYENRKVEIFYDGQSCYAQDGKSTGPTALGELPVPPLKEISEDSQFDPITITKIEFEKVWDKAISG